MTLDCGHEPSENGGAGTGVAYKQENGERWSMCYRCAYIETMDDIVMVGVKDESDLRLPVLYVSGDGRWLTTWDGQTVGRINHWGARHPFSPRSSRRDEERRYFNARIVYGADVVNVYGVGSPGMYALTRRHVSDVRGAVA